MIGPTGWTSVSCCRYELWCIARAAATRYCVIHCELSAEVCRAWNSQRNSPGYSAKVFEDLASRFEPPDTRNRWDTPLIRVNPQADPLSDELQPAIAAVTGRPSSGQSTHVPQAALKMTTAATNSEASTTNLLNELDRTAQVGAGWSEVLRSHIRLAAKLSPDNLCRKLLLPS